MPNLADTIDQLFSDGGELSLMNPVIEPVPTGWNTKVENPGDKKLTKRERRFNTDLALRQGGKPEYVTVALVAPTASLSTVYSGKEKTGASCKKK